MNGGKRTRTLFSEGTRIAAEIYLPPGNAPDSGFPAVLMCHGWSGVKSQLAPYARAMAENGLATMIFDYRGWGESDGRIIATRDAPPLLDAGECALTVRVLREIVDPVDQVADVNNCLAALASEPSIDYARIGIWGTSFGAGHAVFVGGTNPLVKAIVAQVGGYGLVPEYREHALTRAVEKVRGTMEPAVPQGTLDALPGLSGSPDLARMLYHSPLTAAAAVRAPTLIIDVDEEELVDRLKHGFAAWEIIRQHAICEYRLLPGRHYDIYNRHANQSSAMARSWFEQYL